MSIRYQTLRDQILPAIHFVGLGALAAAAAAFARWPGDAVVLFLCGGLLWLGILWAAAYRFEKKRGTHASVQSAFISVLPWYMRVPVCGLLAIAIEFLPYAVAYRINSVEIRQLGRYDRFVLAVALMVEPKLAYPKPVPPPVDLRKLLREIAAGDNSADVRKFLRFYTLTGRLTTDSGKNAAILASKLILKKAPAHSRVRIDGRWRKLLLRSAVFEDYANGRSYYYLVTDTGLLLIRPMVR